MAGDTRTEARDAAYDFLNDPTKDDAQSEPLAVLGMINMLFPRLEIDWNAAGMIVDAIRKAREADKG